MSLNGDDSLPLLGGRTKRSEEGGQTAVTILGLLPLQCGDALVLGRDHFFEGFYSLVLGANGDQGLFEPFAQVLIGLLRLCQLVFCVQQRFIQDPVS